MALYIDGKKIVNSLVIDGNAYDKAVILEGTASTNKWAEPLVYSSVNALDYEVLCFSGTDQGNAFRVYYNIADLPISPNPVQDENYTQFSQNGYLYVDENGVLYFCVSTTNTLVLNEVLAYKTSDVGGGIDYTECWIITNNSTTMSTHIEYTNNGQISSYAVYSQAGNTTQTEGDMAIRIGSDTNWKWLVTALDDMTYKIYDVANSTLSELRTATNGTVILSNIEISGNITYEIRRYS